MDKKEEFASTILPVFQQGLVCSSRNETTPAARTVKVGGMSSLPGSGKRCAVQFQLSGTMAKQMKRATPAAEQSCEGDCFKYVHDCNDGAALMADKVLKMADGGTKQQNSVQITSSTSAHAFRWQGCTNNRSHFGAGRAAAGSMGAVPQNEHPRHGATIKKLGSEQQPTMGPRSSPASSASAALTRTSSLLTSVSTAKSTNDVRCCIRTALSACAQPLQTCKQPPPSGIWSGQYTSSVGKFAEDQEFNFLESGQITGHIANEFGQHDIKGAWHADGSFWFLELGGRFAKVSGKIDGTVLAGVSNVAGQLRSSMLRKKHEPQKQLPRELKGILKKHARRPLDSKVGAPRERLVPRVTWSGEVGGVAYNSDLGDASLSESEQDREAESRTLPKAD